MNNIENKYNSHKNVEKEYETILIEEICRRPFLYDKNHEYYSKFQLRVDAWKEIADHLKKPVKELKSKWETLRYTYRKFYKKMNKHVNEGKCIIKWIHYDNMKFLNGHIKLDNVEQSSEQASEQVEMEIEFDKKLIAEVVKCKNLYDPMNEFYRNMKERAKTWDEVSKTMDAPVEVCKKRWSYCRDTFRKFNKKETEDYKEVSWIHYNSLKFLLHYDTGNLTELKLSNADSSSIPEIPLEISNISVLNHMSLKYENENKNIDFTQSNNLESGVMVEFLPDFVQKCGEILISQKEKFCYKCCACDKNIETIDNFTKHILENHINRNGNISLFEKLKTSDQCQKKEIDENLLNNTKTPDCDEKIKVVKENNGPIVKNEKQSLKYIKTDTKKDFISDEDLKENPSDNVEIKTSCKMNIQNKLVKIGKVAKFPCSLCSFSFDKEENLKKHEENHRHCITQVVENKKEIGFFSCEECDKRFKKRYQLQRHMRLHTGERPYQCTICAQKFRHYDNLKEHNIFRHSDDRPYACRHEGCDKKFKTIKTRSLHEVLHSNDLPFQCDECGKCFRRNSCLKRHRSTWHMDKNDRPYKCPHCPKSFCTQTNLKYHIYTHTGERPFGCPICPSKFTKPWTIKEHMKIHSGERNHICQICGKDFSRISGLIEHKKRHERVTVVM